MVRKLKQIAGSATDTQLASKVKESAHQIWLAGLGAFAKAQDEGSKVFESLVKEGEAVQAKTRKAAEDKVTEIAGKASGTWDRLEQVFEDRVARALHSLGVPTKQDIQTLSKRVAELTEAMQKLNESEEGAAKPRRRTTAK